MRTLGHAVVTVSGILIMGVLGGCGQEGLAERTGKKVDGMVENAQSHVQSAAEKVGNAVENAGETLKEKSQQ